MTHERTPNAVAAADVEVAAGRDHQRGHPQLQAAGLKAPASLPDFRQRLSALGKDRQYFMWRQASQFVHPGSRALEQQRATHRDLPVPVGTYPLGANYRPGPARRLGLASRREAP